MKHWHAIFMVVVLVGFGHGPAIAQFVSAIDSVEVSQFPVIRLHAVSTLNGALYRNYNSSRIRIWEDGIEQKPVQVSCPSGSAHMEIAFIIGNGGSVSAGLLGNQTEIVRQFIAAFDGEDYGGVSTAGSNPPPKPELTADPVELENAIDNSILVPVNTPNRFYDAVLESLTQISGKGAIVVLGDGMDNGSTASWQAAKSAVESRGCKFYYFPVGTLSVPAWITEIVNTSGGFVSTSFPDPVIRVINAQRRIPDACILSYESSNLCAEAWDRIVHVEIIEQTDTARTTVAFQPAENPGRMIDLAWDISDATVTSGKSVRIDITQMTQVSKRYLYSGSVELAFDTSAVRIDSAGAYGALAGGSNFTVVPASGGAQVRFTGVSPMNGKGNAFYLYITPAESPVQRDVSITPAGVSLSRGCLNIQISGGVVHVLPKSASIEITNSPTLAFTWDNVNQRYSPESAELVIGVKNNGDLDVSGLTAELALPAGLRLSAFSDPTPTVEPLLLKPGESGTARWFIKPVPQPAPVSGQCSVTVVSKEGATTDKQIFYTIDAASKGIRFTGSVEPVVVQNGEAVPNPVTVTASLRSIGENPAGTVEIVLPTGLSLMNSPSMQPYQALSNGAEATPVWAVTFKETVDTAKYELYLVRNAPGETPDTLVLPLTVPGVTEPRIEVRCPAESGHLTFDEQLNDYLPNPFRITFKYINTGPVTVDTLEVYFKHSRFMERHQNDSFRIMNFAPEDTSTFILQLTFTGRFCDDYTDTIECVVRYKGGKESNCITSVLIPGLRGRLGSLVEHIPPSLVSVEQGVPQVFRVKAADPMDTTLTYMWYVGTERRVESADSLEAVFPVTGPESVRCLITNICGDTAVAEWTFDVVLDLEHTPSAANGFALLGNYPNPFNPSTTIEYAVPDGEHIITLELLNASGSTVQPLFANCAQGGRHKYELHAPGLPSGVYFVRLRSGSVTVIRPVALVK